VHECVLLTTFHLALSESSIFISVHKYFAYFVFVSVDEVAEFSKLFYTSSLFKREGIDLIYVQLMLKEIQAIQYV
jgi:hypothetical protein